MATLDLDDISKIYPGSRDRAVDHVSMKIEDGEIIALPYGCCIQRDLPPISF